MILKDNVSLLSRNPGYIIYLLGKANIVATHADCGKLRFAYGGVLNIAWVSLLELLVKYVLDWGTGARTKSQGACVYVSRHVRTELHLPGIMVVSEGNMIF